MAQQNNFGGINSNSVGGQAAYAMQAANVQNTSSSSVTVGQFQAFPPSQPQGRAPPPPHYVCHRCGIRGHYINECPTNSAVNAQGKRYTGIPTSFLTPVTDPDTTGAFIMSKIEAEAYAEGMMQNLLTPDSTVKVEEYDPQQPQMDRLQEQHEISLLEEALANSGQSDGQHYSTYNQRQYYMTSSHPQGQYAVQSQATSTSLPDSSWNGGHQQIVPPKGIRRPAGIPNTFLKIVDDPRTPGAFVTSTGQFAVERRAEQAYEEVKESKPDPRQVLLDRLHGMPPQVIKAALTELEATLDKERKSDNKEAEHWKSVNKETEPQSSSVDALRNLLTRNDDLEQVHLMHPTGPPAPGFPNYPGAYPPYFNPYAPHPPGVMFRPGVPFPPVIVGRPPMMAPGMPPYRRPWFPPHGALALQPPGTHVNPLGPRPSGPVTPLSEFEFYKEQLRLREIRQSYNFLEPSVDSTSHCPSILDLPFQRPAHSDTSLSSPGRRSTSPRSGKSPSRSISRPVTRRSISKRSRSPSTKRRSSRSASVKRLPRPPKLTPTLPMLRISRSGSIGRMARSRLPRSPSKPRRRASRSQSRRRVSRSRQRSSRPRKKRSRSRSNRRKSRPRSSTRGNAGRSNSRRKKSRSRSKSTPRPDPWMLSKSRSRSPQDERKSSK